MRWLFGSLYGASWQLSGQCFRQQVTLAEKPPAPLASGHPLPCALSQQNDKGHKPPSPGASSHLSDQTCQSQKGEKKKKMGRGKFMQLCLLWGLRTSDPEDMPTQLSPWALEILNDKRRPLAEALLSGRLAPWHHHRDRGMWICVESKKSSTQRMGAWGTLSVCLVVAAFTKAQSSPGIPVNPSSHQLHNGWVWEASKERQKDSHSPKVPSELLSWKFKGSHNTWGCWYTSFGISIVKIKNGITSHENELSLEGTEQRRIESNCKGEEHPKGTHPIFPTKVLPSAKRGRLTSPTGRERGRFPARLPCCSAGTEETSDSSALIPSFHHQSPEAGMPVYCWLRVTAQHRQQMQPTGSRSPTWAPLSRAPDPSCPEQNGR